MVTSIKSLRCPFETQVGDESAFFVKFLNVFDEGLPFEIVHPDIVFGVRKEIEACVVSTESHECVRCALSFRKTGVTMQFAPINAMSGFVLNPNGI